MSGRRQFRALAILGCVGGWASGYNARMPLSRYFRFRLRTLLVVVFAFSWPLAWVAYEINLVRERQKMLARLYPEMRDHDSWQYLPPYPHPNWLRGILGDQDFTDWAIWLPVEEANLQSEAKRLFPEALVSVEEQKRER